MARSVLRLHTTKRRLTRVPEVVVGDCDVLRVTLEVNGTITLSLVLVTTCITIEKVKVVNPYMGVIRIKRHTVIHTVHDGKIAHLQV